MNDKLGVYIHIPFCVSKCGYCDFYSVPGGSRRMPDYQSALLSHISESRRTLPMRLSSSSISIMRFAP